MAIKLPKLDQNMPSGSAGVEITGFPQMLHTRSFGHPDMLFVPLLEGAREAADLCQRLINGGESGDHAVTMSGIQLASNLLKVSGFNLSSRNINNEHSYFVNLAAGTISAQTRLYAEVSRRTSMFNVEIAGKFREGIYAVRIVGDSATTLQFDDQQLHQPMFFTTVLAEQCLHMQVRKTQPKCILVDTGNDDSTEVHLSLFAGGKKIPLVLRQKEMTGEWDMLEAHSRTRIGPLPSTATNHLNLALSEMSAKLADKELPSAPKGGAAPQLVTIAKDSSGS